MESVGSALNWDYYKMNFDISNVSNLTVKIDKKKLVVSGTREKDFFKRFEKVFILPPLVDTEKIVTECKDGELVLSIPKVTKEKAVVA